MFHHIKELQFNARVSGPDPRFARMLLDQFGGPNGELKAAMQYFTQAFLCRRPYPRQYDLLMDIATEEFSHLEIVGATITMLLDGVNGDLKNAAEHSDLMRMMRGKGERESLVQEASISPTLLIETGGGPSVTDSNGVPWSGYYVNANGDLTVDFRSNIAAESRAKIVYEYLMQFTNDTYVLESLDFLMTREIAHFQMFSAALNEIMPNFPPGILQGNPRYTHTYFNMSDGEEVRGSWNQGRGPWPESDQWSYVADPIRQVRATRGQLDQPPEGTSLTESDVKSLDRELSRRRSNEVLSQETATEQQWSKYDLVGGNR